MTDYEILDYETLTERIEDLETKREDLETLSQLTDRLETQTETLEDLSDRLFYIETLETLEVKEIREDLSEVIDLTERLREGLIDLDCLDPLDFLIISQSVRDLIDHDFDSLYDLDLMISLTEDLESEVNDMTETLETLVKGLRQTSDNMVKSRSDSFDFLGPVLRVLSYFDQVNLFSESIDNQKRIDRTLTICLEIIEDLESYSEDLESVIETLVSLKSEIDLRLMRIDQRVKSYETLETSQVISDQLKERTGSSFLDSGGYPQYDSEGHYIGSSQGYGRHYERNQSRDFDSEDPVNIETWSGHGGLTVSLETYSFMRSCLDFDPVLNSLFREYDLMIDPQRSSYWSENIETFLDRLDSLFGISGIYGEGQRVSVNTYNHDSLLTQVIQYTLFSVSDLESRVILQTHNGCDVRGGYSDPIIYYLTDFDQTGILRDSDLSVYIDPDPEIRDLLRYPLYGYIESGYHLYFDQSLEDLCPHYDWSGKKRSQKIMRLKSEIDRLEDLISEYVTVRDPYSESDRQTLDSLLTILTKKRETLEDLSDWRHERSLTLSSFYCIDRDDLSDPDFEYDLTSETPVIIYWRDHETGEKRLKILGLGSLYFDFFID